MKRNILLAWTVIFLSLCSVSFGADASISASSAISRIGNTIMKTFRSLDLYLDQSSKKLSDNSVSSVNQQAISGKTFVAQGSTTSIDPFTLNPILNEIRFGVAYAFDVAYVDSNGIIQGVQPPFAGVIGTDISGQEQFQRVQSSRMPVLSKEFLAAEGFYSVAFQHPILTSDGLFLGATSILIRPQTLLRSIIDNETKGIPVDVWVMQPDGRIIYDKDDEEIGKNLFTDDLYKPFFGLVEFGKMISTVESGSSKYDFFALGTDKVVTKNADWITLDVYGTQWKIIATTSLDKSQAPERTLCQLGAETIGQALVRLSKDEGFIEAAYKGDIDAVKGFLDKFQKQYPCYSVQWVDAKLVNKVGSPSVRSLSNYQFDASRGEKESGFVAAVNSRKEAVIKSPLFEGGIGKFHLAPMFKGSDYLGMVYYIWIEP